MKLVATVGSDGGDDWWMEVFSAECRMDIFFWYGEPFLYLHWRIIILIIFSLHLNAEWMEMYEKEDVVAYITTTEERDKKILYILLLLSSS